MNKQFISQERNITMKQIQVKELTVENFKIYGSFSNLINPDAPKLGPGLVECYRDMERIDLGSTSVASFTVMHMVDRPKIIQKLEYHNNSGEALALLDGDGFFTVAPATRSGEAPQADQIEVFRVPRGTLVTLRPGVWHHAPFISGCAVLNVLVVLPERTYATDCYFTFFKEEDYLEIV
jgi:ureidoglycolate lyase